MPMNLIIPDNLTTFAERLEFAEAAREALRIIHNATAKRLDMRGHPQRWREWERSWFRPRSTAISVARNALMRGRPTPVDEDGMPFDKEAAAVKQAVREGTRCGIVSPGDRHPLVAELLNDNVAAFGLDDGAQSPSADGAQSPSAVPANSSASDPQPSAAGLHDDAFAAARSLPY